LVLRGARDTRDEIQLQGIGRDQELTSALRA
jgi:hypothetical protein